MKTRMLSIKFVVTITLLSILLLYVPRVISAENEECKEIKVAIHIVKNSGITKEQMDAWLTKANEVWKCSLKFVKAQETDEVDKKGDNKVAGAINIYAVKEANAEPKDVSECDDQKNIAIPPGVAAGGKTKDDTLAHELGHWFGAKPDNTKSASEHGDPVYDPTTGEYKGRDTDGDGDHDADDTKNIMYPGCKRTGQKVDDTQQARAKKNADEWLKKEDAKKKGSGKDEDDAVGDVDAGYIDLDFTEVWAEHDTLYLTLTVTSFLSTDCKLGFMIESDSNLDTGDPLEGIDYYVGFNPAYNGVIFERYDENWVSLDPTGIAYEFVYIHKDEDVEPITIGISFTLPLTLLERRVGNLISYRGIGETDTLIDTSPDAGLKNITVPYELWIFAHEGGTTNPAPGSYLCLPTTMFTVTAKPDPGWVFDRWELDGVIVSRAISYTVKMDDNHVLEAFFKKVPVGGKSVPAYTVALPEPWIAPTLVLSTLVAAASIIALYKRKRKARKAPQ